MVAQKPHAGVRSIGDCEIQTRFERCRVLFKFSAYFQIAVRDQIQLEQAPDSLSFSPRGYAPLKGDRTNSTIVRFYGCFWPKAEVDVARNVQLIMAAKLSGIRALSKIIPPALGEPEHLR